jgi:hypothetical protein
LTRKTAQYFHRYFYSRGDAPVSDEGQTFDQFFDSFDFVCPCIKFSIDARQLERPGERYGFACGSVEQAHLTLFDPFVLPPLALMLEATRDSGGELERPAVGKCIDVLLSLGLVQLVLGLNLSHEVVLAFERSDIGRTELRPFSRDLRAHTNRVLCVGDVLGHIETPKKFTEKERLEQDLFKPSD